MIWKLLLVLLLVATNGFFVAAEFALVKVRLGEVRALARAGSRRARLVESILGRLDSYLSGCQLGITLASLGLGWVGEPLVAKSLEPLFHHLGIAPEQTHIIAFPISFALITFLHITIGEQVPKMLAIKKYQPTSLAVAYPLHWFTVLFKPFIWMLNASSNVMLGWIGIRVMTEHGEVPTQAELRMLVVESAAGGHLSSRERLIMENALDLSGKVARAHMLPRNRIVTVDNNIPVADALRIAARSSHTRLPVCDGDLSKVLGILHVKDAFRAMAELKAPESLQALSRAPVLLPETATLDIVVREMLKKRLHMALLMDEHGVLSGMITLEDVLEELVGAIQDEFDDEIPLIVEKGENVYEVLAECPLSDAARATGLDVRVETESADTLGGLLIDRLKHFPFKGESVTIGNRRIEVLEAEATRVVRVRITMELPTLAGQESDEPVTG